MLVKPDEWRPVGNITLEPNADLAVRSADNSLVVAGPGAGKTELLAQRACYLLETGLCPEPRMVLAISFKRDAAKNLADRVHKRYGRTLARRFHSFTYDAFAKSLVDRFRLSIPIKYRPSADYEIITRDREIERLLGSASIGFEDGRSLDPRSVVAALTRNRLRREGSDDVEPGRKVVEAVWIYLLHDRQPSSVNFPMLSRLAELLLRKNPLLTTALRSCFSHLFLDEFQDTTEVQYDLLKTAFLGSDSVLTAVGDDKQRIMGWAGAKPKVLDHFVSDFSATNLQLLCNHRSAPRLVQIQHVLAEHLSPGTPSTSSTKNAQHGEGVCKIVLFDNPTDEAAAVSKKIVDLVQNEGVVPRQIAVLARQRVDTYAGQIIEALRGAGILARIESEIQDLLAEPLIELVVAILLLSLGKRDPDSWQRILDVLADVRGSIDRESPKITALEVELQTFLQDVRQEALSCETDCTVNRIIGFFDRVVNFVGEQSFAALYPQYSQGDYLPQIKEKAAQYLARSLNASTSFRSAIDDFLGQNTVPILTIHKSKGLEYDTVFFIGLEDGAFFNYHEQPQEEGCAFFVAFSRAKERAYFTFSQVRNSGRGDSMKSESRVKISTLYEILERAGVEVADLRRAQRNTQKRR